VEIGENDEFYFCARNELCVALNHQKQALSQIIKSKLFHKSSKASSFTNHQKQALFRNNDTLSLRNVNCLR